MLFHQLADDTIERFLREYGISRSCVGGIKELLKERQGAKRLGWCTNFTCLTVGAVRIVLHDGKEV